MFTVISELPIRDAHRHANNQKQQHKWAINYEVADNNGKTVSHSDPTSKSFLHDGRMKCTLHTMAKIFILYFFFHSLACLQSAFTHP